MAVRNLRFTRRVALRSLVGFALSAFPLVHAVSRASAQGADSSFSDQILPTLELPEIDLEQHLDGVKGVPDTLSAGTYLVNYTAVDAIGYLLFAQYPDGTPMDKALAQAKAAGSNDQQQPGWLYAGGTYAMPGATVQVVVELPAGGWNVVASHMPPDSTNYETDEIYEIVPLSVTDASALPASPVAQHAADVDVDLPGMAFVLSTDTIAAGPKLWKFSNTSDQSHHVVIARTSKVVTSADITEMVTAMSSGTPPTSDAWFTQSIWVGYTALFSPGHHVWNEFDFDPGDYLLACYIADIETGMPHLMMGMWKAFTVE
jgi:hypothetical protein